MLAVWSVLGCIATNFLSLPKTRKQAIILFILLGPICWIWVGFFILEYKERKK